MLLIVYDKYRVLFQGYAGYLQVQVTNDLTCMFKLRLNLTKPPGRPLLVMHDGHCRQQNVQPRQVVRGAL
jgi:hypothetical protein